MDIINMILGVINSSWAWPVFLFLLGWVWVAKTAADDVDCAHINDLQTKKVDTDWKDYKARAWRNGAQLNIANNTWTKVELNAESYDPGGNFDHTVNYRFTAPVAGFYLVCYELRFADVVTDKNYDCRIYKNGANAVSNQTAHSSFAENVGVSGADILELAVDDFIELWGRQISGVGTVDFYGSEPTTYMSVHILSI